MFKACLSSVGVVGEGQLVLLLLPRGDAGMELRRLEKTDSIIMYCESVQSIMSITFISENCNDMIKPRYENIAIDAFNSVTRIPVSIRRP